MGQYLSQTQGEAGSGWGIGSTPYGVAPKPAPNTATAENREGERAQDNVQAEQYEGLYAPNEYAHSSQDKRVQGRMDMSKAPEKVEEVRSAPEDQKALREYVGAVSAYAEGEEEAINREQVPLEYQELVRQYFDDLKKSAKSKAK